MADSGEMGATVRQRVHKAILAVDDVLEGLSIFRTDESSEWALRSASRWGTAFFVDSRQMAEFGEGNTIGIRLSREVIREHRERLKADPRVDLRRSGSDWVIVTFRRATDIPFVIELVELAAACYRPPPGVAAKPPPTGADLERRRRWH